MARKSPGEAGGEINHCQHGWIKLTPNLKSVYIKVTHHPHIFMLQVVAEIEK